MNKESNKWQLELDALQKEQPSHDLGSLGYMFHVPLNLLKVLSAVFSVLGGRAPSLTPPGLPCTLASVGLGQWEVSVGACRAGRAQGQGMCSSHLFLIRAVMAVAVPSIGTAPASDPSCRLPLPSSCQDTSCEATWGHRSATVQIWSVNGLDW